MWQKSSSFSFVTSCSAVHCCVDFFCLFFSNVKSSQFITKGLCNFLLYFIFTDTFSIKETHFILENNMCSIRKKRLLKKLNVFGLNKIKLLSVRWTLLENLCLFEEHMVTYRQYWKKNMSVRRTDRPSWKIIKRLLLKKKNRYCKNRLGGCFWTIQCVRNKTERFE